LLCPPCVEEVRVKYRVREGYLDRYDKDGNIERYMYSRIIYKTVQITNGF
jgi:hypothetical protein